jgi:hypothetical protein
MFMLLGKNAAKYNYTARPITLPAPPMGARVRISVAALNPKSRFIVRYETKKLK